MKNLKDSNFAPTQEDIFKKDSTGNVVYSFLGRDYPVSNLDIQKKIIELEGYKPFIFSTKPPIFMPIIVIALIVAILASFVFHVTMSLRSIMLYVSIGLYLVAVAVYYLSMYRIIRKTR